MNAVMRKPVWSPDTRISGCRVQVSIQEPSHSVSISTIGWLQLILGSVLKAGAYIGLCQHETHSSMELTSNLI